MWSYASSATVKSLARPGRDRDQSTERGHHPQRSRAPVCIGRLLPAAPPQLAQPRQEIGSPRKGDQERPRERIGVGCVKRSAADARNASDTMAWIDNPEEERDSRKRRDTHQRSGARAVNEENRGDDPTADEDGRARARPRRRRAERILPQRVPSAASPTSAAAARTRASPVTRSASSPGK